MRCVVVGGSGFIGSHVTDALVTAGHDVTIVDVKLPHRTDVAFSQSSVQDLERLTEIFGHAGRDAVFHLAAVANAREALNDPVHAVDLNIGGTARVLEAARKAQVRRVILASTVWYYNAVDQSAPIDGATRYLTEAEPILPSGGGHVYTTSKIASELLCHDFQRLYGAPFTILRYGIPYGPRMWPGLALRAFIESSLEGKPIRIFGDGSAVRRFLYVEDLARAHVLALRPEAENQTYNLEGDRDVTIRELAETVGHFIPGTVIEYIVDSARRGELALNGVVISNEKARRGLNWQPTVELRQGVESVVKWFFAARDKITAV